jgi:hypothetical protein
MLLENRTAIAGDTLALLEQVVSDQKTLEDVVRWGLSQTPPIAITAVVTQDEYTHDVVIGTGAPEVFLVYDVT